MDDDYRAILRLIDSRLSLPLVYAACHRVIASRMSAANMYVSLVEGAGLRFPYYIDEHDTESTLLIVPRRGWTAFVLDSGRRYWLSVDPPLPEAFQPIGTIPSDWLGVPLLDRDETPIGALVVQAYEPGARYTEEDLAFVEFTASALALAVQLARQDRELAIRRIASLVDETVDIGDLYARIHDVMKSVLPASRKNIVIAKVDEDAGVFRTVYWRDEKDGVEPLSWTFDTGFSGYIYRISKASYIHEAGKTPVPPEVRQTGYPSKYWLGAPLFGRDRITGMVVIQSYDDEYPITKEDQYALDGICPYIAAAIGETELFHRSRCP